jgi:hypothetical protein
VEGSADWLEGIEKLLTDCSLSNQGASGFHSRQKPDSKQDLSIFGELNIITAEKDIVTL